MNGQTIVAHIGDLSWPKALIYGAVLTALYYFFAFNDGSALQQQLDGSAIELTAAKHGLDQTKKALVDAAKFEKEVVALEAQFQKIRTFMPEKLNPTILTDILNKQAALAGAAIAKIEPVKENAAAAAPPASTGSAADDKDRPDFYEATRMEILVEGSFSQIAKFLSNISKVPVILTFDHFKLVEAGGLDVEHPKLNMTGTLTGYRYKTKAPDKNAKPPAPGAASGPAGAPNGH